MKMDQIPVASAGKASGFKSRPEVALDPPEATSGRAKKPLHDEDYPILSPFIWPRG